ncbi:MAG: DUF2116 family Zn-ribbon domain-containing protein [Methanobrevibacter sp.]|jgi:predicted nucleic acid-binding Zn ribbon protein|nr:DUF2116 family Zn-ribbon domain-containing protein [Candidatus Methanoflexus mossambicus]
MVDVHKHCPMCGTPIPLDEITCSNKCQVEYNNRVAKAKRSQLISLGIMVFVILIIVIMILSKNNIF